jgi:hypothetical protein
VEKQFRITGMDWSNREQIIICDVAYDGEWLRFQSLHPSSGRTGTNWMRVVDRNKVEFRFTSTDQQIWVRKQSGVKETRPVRFQAAMAQRTPRGGELVSAQPAS